MKSFVTVNAQSRMFSQNDIYRQLLAVFAEFMALVALLATVVGVVLTDAAILRNGLSERSLTELLQGALVFGSALLFGLRAHGDAQSRGYLTLLATLFACMFVRENDAVLDLVHHGFRVVPAAFIALFGGTLVNRNSSTLIEPFLRHFRARHATFIYIGLLVLLVFSRLFGTGSLWQAVMASDYQASFKTVVQEGLELLGYALIAYGSLLSFRNGPIR